jgi:hypothetical protein
VWGTGCRVSFPYDALLTGTFVQGFELEDLHILGFQQAGATVIPAACRLQSIGMESTVGVTWAELPVVMKPC